MKKAQTFIPHYRQLLFLLMILGSLHFGYGQGQQDDKILIATVRQGQAELQISSRDWREFMKANYSVLFREFYYEQLQLAKTESNRYYLLAEAKYGGEKFAFELTEVDQQLFFSKYQELHMCSEGKQGIQTFKQRDGKIVGCQKGNHTISKTGRPRAQKD